jgi:hypothetical protein
MIPIHGELEAIAQWKMTSSIAYLLTSRFSRFLFDCPEQRFKWQF